MVKHTRLFPNVRRPAIGTALRTAGRGLVISAALVFLAGCEFFAQSPFPGYLPGLKESADLSGILEDPETHDIRLSVLKSPLGGEKLFLHQKPFNAGYTTLTIFDSSIRKLTMRQEDDFNRFGSLLLIDWDFRYISGSFAFQPTDVTTPTTEPMLKSYAYDSVGFSNFHSPTGWPAFDTNSRNYILRINPWMDPDELMVLEFSDGNWSSPTFSYLWMTPVPDGRNFRLEGAIYVPEKGSGTGFVIIVLSEEWTREGWMVIVQDNPTGITFQNFLSTYPTDPGYVLGGPDLPGKYLTRSLGPIQSGGVQFTSAGLLVQHEDEEVLIDFKSREILDRRQLDRRQEYRYAYSPDGDHYYLLDILNKRLYKASTWW